MNKERCMLTAFVMIQCEPDRIVDIGQSIANTPHVAEVYSVTGEYDIIAVVRLPEYDLLAEVVPQALAHTSGILRTNTVLAFRRFSAKDLEAAWDIGVS
jgi:DNA-binding Lrp family transcriptional regulator